MNLFLTLVLFHSLMVTLLALPVVDPGVFIIQGISSCANSSGYCMMGADCTSDIDFMPAPKGQHCDGLADAFSPAVAFSCCEFNKLGKLTSEKPTTVIDPFTITGPTLDFEELPVVDYFNFNNIEYQPTGGSVIDIVGVVTDTTGVLGLVTQRYTSPPPPTTTTTPSPAPLQHDANSSHHSFSLAGYITRLTGLQDVINLPQKPVHENKDAEKNKTMELNVLHRVNETSSDDEKNHYQHILQYKDDEKLPIIPIQHLSFSVTN